MSETTVPETAFVPVKYFPTTTILRLCHLEAVSQFVSNEETRYYLQGVSIKRHPTKGVDLCATDGHSLGLIHAPDAVHTGDDEFILRTKDIIAAAKLVWKGWAKSAIKERYIVIDRSSEMNAKVRFVIGASPEDILRGDGKDYSLAVDDVIIDGTFPDYSKVFPTFDGKINSSGRALNAPLLEQVTKAAKLFAGARNVAPILLASPSDDAAPRMFVVDAKDEHDSDAELVGILMPIRSRSKGGASVEARRWLCEKLGRINPNAKVDEETNDADKAIAA